MALSGHGAQILQSRGKVGSLPENRSRWLDRIEIEPTGFGRSGVAQQTGRLRVASHAAPNLLRAVSAKPQIRWPILTRRSSYRTEQFDREAAENALPRMNDQGLRCVYEERYRGKKNPTRGAAGSKLP